jgi:protein phosphatase
MSDITFKMTVATNVGLVRSNNEDNFIVCPNLDQADNWFAPCSSDEVIALGENGCVMVVADGMGGMNAGEVASEITVNTIRDQYSSVGDFSKIADCSNHIEAFMKRVIVEADKQIKKRVKEDPSTQGMGTTVVIAWIVGDVAHIAWCGDSRAYLFNRQSGLSRLSSDHSYVQELVNTGKLDPELAFDHPNSNIITRSLGDSPVKAQPDYVCKRLSAGDYVLLCTDGLCGLCRDEEIMDILNNDYPSLEDYRNQLINAALEAGGYDNVTIAILECLKVKEESLASTVPPTQMFKRSKAEKKQETKVEAAPEANGETESVENNENNGDVASQPAKRRRIGLWVVIALLLLLIVSAGVAHHFGITKIEDIKQIISNKGATITNTTTNNNTEAPASATSTSTAAPAPAPASATSISTATTATAPAPADKNTDTDKDTNTNSNS